MHRFRKTNLRGSSARCLSKRNSSCHDYQSLEVRQMLAFSGFFDGATATLTLDQTADDGIVTINNDGPGGLIEVSDFSGTDHFAAATNLTVNFLDGINAINLEINTQHVGDLELNLGDGQRAVSFLGTDNSIGGDLTITSNFGDQTLALSQVTNLNIGGNVFIDTGFGADLLSSQNVFFSEADVMLSGVNEVIFHTSFGIGGSFSVDNSGENVPGQFDQTSGDLSVLGGNFSYVGGNGIDDVQLSTIDIAGNLDVDLGSGFTGGIDSQEFRLSSFEVENLKVFSGDNDNIDDVRTSSGIVNGDVDLDLGEGLNAARLDAIIHGNSVSYVGGSSIDDVVFDSVGAANQHANVQLGGGNDAFALGPSAHFGNLHVDYGTGDDFFGSVQTQLTFDTQLISLDRFNHEYDSATDTLVSTEVASPMAGFHSFDTMAALDSAVRVNGHVITATSNLVIDLLEDGVEDLRVSLDADPLAGDLIIDLGSIGTFVGFSGTNNRVVGDVTIVGGDGDHEVRLDTNQSLAVGGTLDISLGAGVDRIAELTNGLIAANVQLTNVNNFVNSGSVSIAGNLSMDASEELVGINFKNNGPFTMGGNFNLRGSDSGHERIQFDSIGAATIGGHFNANLGGNLALSAQMVAFEANTTVEGNVTVRSTSDQRPDLFLTEPTAFIGGNVLVDLGASENSVAMFHTNAGESIRVFNGDGSSEVHYGVVGDPANVYVTFGSGDDTFIAHAVTDFDELLRLEFGGGNGDEFIYHAGDFAQNVSLFDLQGFDAFYTVNNDRLKVKQVRDIGKVEVHNDNNGIEISNDNASLFLTPAASVQVSMQAESAGSLAVDLDTPLAGDMILKLRRGDRDVYFTGDANEINGDLRIGASEGMQNINLATTTDMDIAGKLAINLREGFDSVFDNAKEIKAGDLGIRNVDEYEITNRLQVDGDVVVSTFTKNEDARFDNDGELMVGGKFTYIGGTGADGVLLGGNTFIADNVYIDLASNQNGSTAQLVSLGDGFEAKNRVTVVGASSVNGNYISSDATTRIGGDLYVNFSNADSQNYALLMGQYGGGSGAYRGGSGIDDVTFGADAIDMAFSTFLHGGDDELELLAESDLLSMFNDFGDGTDSFIDDSVNEFPMTTVNLP